MTGVANDEIRVVYQMLQKLLLEDPTLLCPVSEEGARKKRDSQERPTGFYHVAIDLPGYGQANKYTQYQTSQKSTINPSRPCNPPRPSSAPRPPAPPQSCASVDLPERHPNISPHSLPIALLATPPQTTLFSDCSGALYQV